MMGEGGGYHLKKLTTNNQIHKFDVYIKHIVNFHNFLAI